MKIYEEVKKQTNSREKVCRDNTRAFVLHQFANDAQLEQT